MDKRGTIDVTSEMLESIEAFGAVLFDLKECAVLLQVEYCSLKSEFRKKEALWAAYEKGRLTSLFEVRKNIFEMAKHGSGPAQTIVAQLEMKQRLNYEEDVTNGE